MKTAFFKCDCNHGGLHLSYNNVFGLEIAHLVRDPYQRSWRYRFAAAWSALCGKPYQDMVILNNAQIADLVDYLIAVQNESSDERYNEKLEHIETMLCGLGHCDTVVDGILKWINSSDCSSRAANRLKESL